MNLPGFAKFFKESAEEEMKHAQMVRVEREREWESGRG